jgi:acetylornithine deacetylase/succinyl-diaminopimelate desuccinylase-like protein
VLFAVYKGSAVVRVIATTAEFGKVRMRIVMKPGILFVLGTLAIAVFGRTAVYSQGLFSEPQLARDIYKELIEINTTDSVGSTTVAAEAMAKRLKTAGYAASDVQVLGAAPRKGNLVVRLRGTGARGPLLLLAHIDVVEARREDWSTDPFKLVEQDGYFYARGATDNKAMAAIFVTNLIRYKKEGFVPDRDIIVALTADEELLDVPTNGVGWLLKNHRNLVDAELALNEGGGVTLKNGKPLMKRLQLGEKVSVMYRLEVKDRGGHAATPRKDTAINRLAEGLARLAKYDFPVKLTAATRGYFERMADFESGQEAADMHAILRDPPDPAAVARLSSRPNQNAQLRTTCVATRFQAGIADNAMPQIAQALVNCRVLPGEPVSAVKETLFKVLGDDRITVTQVGVYTLSPPSPLNPEIVQAIEKVSADFWPGIPLVPVMSTGATDARFLRNAGIATYGHSGLAAESGDGRAHGQDERLRVHSFFDGLEYLYRLVKTLSSR